ncbi:MBL fold metallo-hydrolase [Conexibacter sp. DBS9H8]|uniref:MBL fold metallo-hydrolase n=1 Tax=Conexibacter sp. DBS9H8 TaxID=2937801 RepID=UPI00200C0139|nr:MBL fold metallo-hydrolase [Conexibacter sp. DBS9H8]
MSRPELGRGERILPGLFRLRLPLPWPGVPHCNAWAVRAGDGLILVDCGMHQDGSLDQLEYALTQVGLTLDQVTHLVITHAHADHYGQAATVVARTGAPLWMHPDIDHARAGYGDPDGALARRYEIGRQSGVPDRPLRSFLEHYRDLPSGIAAFVAADHPLTGGVTLESDLGPLVVYDTPGHAPSHVCLFAPESRVLISGDHLLGRVSLYFDYGWTPDPIAEFLGGLDTVEALDARLCVSGHGRPFSDVDAHIRANRDLVQERLRATLAGLADMPLTALELVPGIFGEPLTPITASWRLPETLSYLTHLERAGAVRRERDGPEDAERWRQA